MFIQRDNDGRPVSYTGSFYKAEWDAAVAEYEAKAEAAKASAPPKTAEKRSAAKKTAASKED